MFQERNHYERKQKARYLKKCSQKNMLDNIDLFQQPLPSFNMQGSTNVASVAGGLASFAIFLVLLLYGVIKLI